MPATTETWSAAKTLAAFNAKVHRLPDGKWYQRGNYTSTEIKMIGRALSARLPPRKKRR